MSPIAPRIILFLFNNSISEFSAFTKIDIKASTSYFGLFQFSVENAYSVKNLTPISADISTICFTDFTPA